MRDFTYVLITYVKCSVATPQANVVHQARKIAKFVRPTVCLNIPNRTNIKHWNFYNYSYGFVYFIVALYSIYLLQ